MINKHHEQGLNPPGSRPDSDHEPRPLSAKQQTTQGSSSNRLLWILIGFVVALTLVVVLVLPNLVAQRSNDETALPRPGSALQPAPLAVSVSRHDAELALQGFLRLRARPGLVNAEVWAAADWQVAIDAAADGDDLYGNGHFEEALASYKKASLKLQTLLDNRSQYLADSLAAAEKALAVSKTDEAVAAFERVLSMQPQHEQAAAGLRRARVRNDILKLMVDAQQAQLEHDLLQAARAYDSVLNLDADYLPARNARQQVQQAIDKQEFQKVMSEVLKNLEMTRLQAARNALMKAAAIYPDHPSVMDARSRLADAGRGASLNSLRRQADSATNREDWNAAAEIYRKALAIDGQAAFASSGLAYSRQRARLHAEFRHYLSDPSRLYSNEPMANARRLLAANKQVPENEPMLTAMQIKLQDAVRLALIPVELTIYSDKNTEVAIYHVGRLGRFEQKTVSLRPGDYTVTGTRAGFRDVRRILKLRAGEHVPPLLIRCEEPV